MLEIQPTNFLFFRKIFFEKDYSIIESTIREQFTQEILNQVLNYFRFQKEEAQLLDVFKCFIYKVSKAGQEYILQISRRSPDLVRGESEFLNYLSKNGLSVPQVLASKHGRMVESIPTVNRSQFLKDRFSRCPC